MLRRPTPTTDKRRHCRRKCRHGRCFWPATQSAYAARSTDRTNSLTLKHPSNLRSSRGTQIFFAGHFQRCASIQCNPLSRYALVTHRQFSGISFHDSNHRPSPPTRPAPKVIPTCPTTMNVPDTLDVSASLLIPAVVASLDSHDS